MKDTTKIQGLVQTSIRIAVAAGIAMFISIGVFAIDDAFASDDTTVTAEESQQSDEGARLINMNCPEEKEKRVTLKVIDETVKFSVSGCYCTNQPENLKKKALEIVSSKNRRFKGIFPDAPFDAYFEKIFGPITVKAGKTVTKTYYCYSAEQLIQLAQDEN